MSDPTGPVTIFILSGGVGASGEQLAYTVLAQFPDSDVHVVTIGNIRQESQVTDALEKACAAGGVVLHTLVDASLRAQLAAQAQVMGISAIDLMGPLIDWLAVRLDRAPLQEPGKYRQVHHQYFDRVAAIDYALKHDDGKHPEGWSHAEILVTGVSRTGKTPLSVYLAVLGWKVANYPLVPQIPTPDELFALDPRRVVGLIIDPEQLLVYRRQRQARLGVANASDYTNLDYIKEELRTARAIFRRGGFHILNMTDKTIEQGADEIMRIFASQGIASVGSTEI